MNGHGKDRGHREHDSRDGIKAEADPSRGADEGKPPGSISVKLPDEALLEPFARIIRSNGWQPLHIFNFIEPRSKELPKRGRAEDDVIKDKLFQVFATSASNTSVSAGSPQCADGGIDGQESDDTML